MPQGTCGCADYAPEAHFAVDLADDSVSGLIRESLVRMSLILSTCSSTIGSHAKVGRTLDAALDAGPLGIGGTQE